MSPKYDLIYKEAGVFKAIAIRAKNKAEAETIAAKTEGDLKGIVFSDENIESSSQSDSIK